MRHGREDPEGEKKLELGSREEGRPEPKKRGECTGRKRTRTLNLKRATNHVLKHEVWLIGKGGFSLVLVWRF